MTEPWPTSSPSSQTSAWIPPSPCSQSSRVMSPSKTSTSRFHAASSVSRGRSAVWAVWMSMSHARADRRVYGCMDGSPHSDEALLLSGEPEDFGRFYDRYVRSLLAYFQRRTRD